MTARLPATGEGTSRHSFCLRARWILPVSSPPIENGQVVVTGSRIDGVGAVREPPLVADVIDFGEAVIMPGLVNVHTHLDYTVMRGLIEDIPFFDWIRELTARKEALDEADWIASATMGAAEAVRGGVTTIGDCTDSGAALIGAKALGLRGTIYQEVFSLDESVPVEEVVSELDLKVSAMRWQASGSRLKIGISPHAPYTVRPDAMQALAQYAREKNLRVCIHAAESQAESELIRMGRGTIADRFKKRGLVWLTPPPGLSTVRYLHDLGALSTSTLLVHGVQLSAADQTLIRDSDSAWAHCPKSNAKLGNGIAPLDLLKGSSARIGLGSDSVASNNTMDLFEEMRFGVLAQRAQSRRYDAMTARDAVEMATLGGAKALGLESRIGTVEPGKLADLIAVRMDGLSAAPCYDPYNSVVYACSGRDVEMTMIAGEILCREGELAGIDLTTTRATFQRAAQKLRDWPRMNLNDRK